MTAEQFQKMQEERRESGQLEPEALKSPTDKHDRALAIDPGKDTGVAYYSGQTDTSVNVRAWTSTFWNVLEALPDTGPEDLFVILEAPYLSAAGSRANLKTAIAYSSGRVAREAELMMKALAERDYHFDEFDPAKYSGGKWDSKFTRQVVGEWEGQDNEHTRDALRLLSYYNFI